MRYGILMSLSVLVLALAVAVPADAKKGISLIEKIEADLALDKAFTPEERTRYAQEFRQQLANYAFDVLHDEKVRGADILMRIVMEGSFDQVPVERTVSIAKAAYIAISRGSTPEVVEGIALYGFRKELPPDKIEAWANGYNDCIKFGVPPYIAEDLVYNAMEHDWDIYTYNTLKWGLIDGSKAGFPIEEFQIYLVGNYLKGKARPGSMVYDAMTYFRKVTDEKKKPELPPYKGSFIPRLQKEEKKVIELVPRAEPIPVTPDAKEPAEKPVTAEEKAKKQKPKAAPAEKKTARKKEAEDTKPPAEKKARAKDEPVLDLKPAPLKGLPPDVLGSMDQSINGFLGVPYVWGGETRQGTDCSGFVRAVYASVGIMLPRTSREQWLVGDEVDYGKFRKGDLLFFITIGNRISHVGIMSSPAEMKFAHASSSKGVTYAKLEDRYYKNRYAGARRILPATVAERLDEQEIEKLAGLLVPADAR